jgi:hypothetical protein
LMDSVQDGHGHVMAETVQPIDKYTGVRVLA